MRKSRVIAIPDKNLWKKHSFIAGVDEAGRGPLAGPVVACAVILPRNYYHAGIDDSKKLTPSKRDSLSKIIKKIAIAYQFGIIDSEKIDEINILQATKLAMFKAINELIPIPEIVLLDAVRLNDLSIPQIPIIKGDTLSLSIAAASILAKVKRDQIMHAYHQTYPQYGFNRHKGYPTKMHRERIKQHGPCAIHRKTFRLLASDSTL
ncbi:ribonuclease HII [candidate division WOR-3 bacterium RBG_13_43_14]|uniref:Ribonuclease HII n=1 Tax=candidate division WOR-3 bacterium RBG_13_43_14 TaxID=1802590 RepID=A0A1F4U2G6_UNCW3|nr:MAG: ribonuclease HII [candidate division WOR-3 bacterium RBG_13_43_14]